MRDLGVMQLIWDNNLFLLVGKWVVGMEKILLDVKRYTGWLVTGGTTRKEEK